MMIHRKRKFADPNRERPKTGRPLVICSLFLLAGCNLTFEENLAARWAPIHVQHVVPLGGQSNEGRADYITAIDYDGNWDTLDNWENLEEFGLPAVGYYSVASTETHWFLIYAFYHPRDWALLSGGAHENDLEGLLAIVRRPEAGGDEQYGSLEAIVTVFHDDFFSFVSETSSFQSGQETIDGILVWREWAGRFHYMTSQEPMGHGLKAYPFVGFEGNSIEYVPSQVRSEEPNTNTARRVQYRLIDIFEPGGLFERRDDRATFAADCSFQGDNGKDDAAHSPWKWDDHGDSDDGPQLTGGELATHPVKLTRIYFSNLGRFEEDYESNPYEGRVECEE